MLARISIHRTDNVFKDDFFFSNSKEVVQTYNYEITAQDWEARKDEGLYYEEFFEPGHSLATTTWFRKYFVEFVSETGGLIVSVLSFASVLIRGYEQFNS